MFKPEEIMTLAKAGFTAQQIASLSMISNAPATAPAHAPAPASAPAPAPAHAPVDPVLQELQKLTGLVQGSNIMNVNQPKVQTPEEILAEIINPAPKGDK